MKAFLLSPGFRRELLFLLICSSLGAATAWLIDGAKPLTTSELTLSIATITSISILAAIITAPAVPTPPRDRPPTPPL